MTAGDIAIGATSGVEDGTDRVPSPPPDAERGADGGAAGRPGGICVPVLVTTGRDASLLGSVMAAGGITSLTVNGPAHLLSMVAEEVRCPAAPRLGALLVTDDALGVDWSARLVEVLDLQPSWSDLPVILLAGASGGSAAPGIGTMAERLTLRSSVTVLDRPVRMAALVSALRAALRARARQMEARELIESRRRAQEEAERQRTEALRAAEVKGQFLANMSHELRTPLNAISGHIELIAMGLYGEVSAQQHEALERVQRAQQHLLGLINDVLNYSRLESGRVEYDLRRTDLADLVADLAAMIEPQMQASGLRFDVELPPGKGLALVDRDKMRQVLLNLLSNAVKFTPRGGHVRMDYGAAGDQENGLVHLRVHDTGIGIPRERQEEIFEPFVQVHRTLTRSIEGTGLGLAISRDLARGMGGDLRVRSRESQGSTFTVTVRRA
jgi:signal transduction histidine kinase